MRDLLDNTVLFNASEGEGSYWIPQWCFFHTIYQCSTTMSPTVGNSSSLRDNFEKRKNGLLSFKLHNQPPNLWLVSRLTIAGWCSASSVSDWSDSRFPWGGDVGSMNGSTKLNRINNNNKHMNWHSLQKPFIIPALYYHIIIISARARTRICWMLQVDRLHRTDPSLRTAPARKIRADRLIRTGPGGPETETCRAL